MKILTKAVYRCIGELYRRQKAVNLSVQLIRLKGNECIINRQYLKFIKTCLKSSEKMFSTIWYFSLFVSPFLLFIAVIASS